MNSSVLAYLENSAEYFPEKCAVTDEKVSYSYSELVKLSSSVGTALSELIVSGDAVGIYMEKCADAVAAFFATVYAGGFYSVLNTELPQNRLQTTVSVLNPKVIVTSESLLETAKEYFSERKIPEKSQVHNLSCLLRQPVNCLQQLNSFRPEKKRFLHIVKSL